MKRGVNPDKGLAKCPTGISGLDEITNGGLPRGRPTLICGGAGCGKTLLAMEFIVRGITQYGEPGAFMSFEETAEELANNVASLGFNVESLIRRKKMAIDFVRVERSEIYETGEFDLEGLFVRLDAIINQIGARRVVLDTIEALFAGIPNEAILRAELRRLFRWLKDKGVTAIITGEQGENTLSRHGLEEYVSDCVILLDHRVNSQVATRRLRIVKYRGSSHGTNEYPTMIDQDGLSVLPISSLGLTCPVTSERVSTGIPRLDSMLGGKGYYRGSSILISGIAGTGKTSLAAAFVDFLCRKGRRAMYLSLEESPDQIIRNMRSIGFNLSQWVRKGLLELHSVRPQLYGLEMHLANVHKLVTKFKPDGVVMDPVTNLTSIGDTAEIKAMLTRLIDFLKNQGVTSIYTSLTSGASAPEQSEVGVSSLMDTWLLVKVLESDGERNRLLYVLKSRGMAHSNQVREFVLSNDGIQLLDVYVGPGHVLTGAARLMQEAKDSAQSAIDQQATEQRRRDLDREQPALRAQIESLNAKLRDVQNELKFAEQRDRQHQVLLRKQRRDLSVARKAD
ncbi:MAG TPA: circadian clock protein KaiC [Acidobacteriota bacterium]|nr:circadian clock protein KaiC [Acidobacteriota bacterium]